MTESGVQPRTQGALLFDLGGVVIDIDFERVFSAWSAMSRLSINDIRQRFRMDESYRRHERGELNWRQYAGHLQRELDLEGPPRRIAQAWNAIFKGEISATLDVIQTVNRRVRCFAFTNSNPTHQADWRRRYPVLQDVFERIYVSCDLGFRKPEPDSFRRVAVDIGCAPADILFFDDSVENVQGARRAGLQAILVTNPNDVVRGLSDKGLLEDLCPGK